MVNGSPCLWDGSDPTNQERRNFVGARSTIVLDHVAFDSQVGGGQDWPQTNADQGFVLRNGATYLLPSGVGMEMQTGNGSFLVVESGSRFSASLLWSRSNVRVRVDDGTISVGGFEATRANATGTMALEIAGANPNFTCSSASTTYGGVTMLFDPPEDPTAWQQAPVRSSGGFATGSHKWTVNLPDKAHVKLSSTGKTRDIPLIYAAGGISTGNIVFGTNPYRSCSFVFSADNKTLYYHYVPAVGTFIRVR